MSNTIARVDIPDSFFEAYAKRHEARLYLGKHELADGFALGLYEFGFAQAQYNAFPFLTNELLAAIMVHEETHHRLTLATSLGHLQLHLQHLYSIASRIPPKNNLARTANLYLAMTTDSSRYSQETCATIQAFCAMTKVYGREAADNYLRLHDDGSLTNPYLKFVKQCISVFDTSDLPVEQWPGYLHFLSSLALNVDIDTLVKSLKDPRAFLAFCKSPELSADARFVQLLQRLPELVRSGPKYRSLVAELEGQFYRDSEVVSSELPSRIAGALKEVLAKVPLGKYDLFALDYFSKLKHGYPGMTNAKTVFVAAHPDLHVSPSDYVDWMTDTDCQGFDLVEMGLCQGIQNVLYGGVNVNFFNTEYPEVKASYSMVHPAVFHRMKDLLRGKTIVVGMPLDLLVDVPGLWRDLVASVADQHLIFFFYARFEKFLSWIDNRKSRLRYCTCDLIRPPVRFMVFRDSEEDMKTFVLPLAPYNDGVVHDILAEVHMSLLDDVLNSVQKFTDFNRFCRWFVFGPVM